MDDVRQRKITRILELVVGNADLLYLSWRFTETSMNFTMIIPDIYTNFNIFLKLKEEKLKTHIFKEFESLTVTHETLLKLKANKMILRRK